MSPSETSTSVADTVSTCLAMNETVAQIDKIATPVPNNNSPYQLSYPVHCLSSPSRYQSARESDQVAPPDCWNRIRPAGSITAESVFEHKMAGVPCLIASSWVWVSCVADWAERLDRKGTMRSEGEFAVSGISGWFEGDVAAKWSGR